LKNVGTIVVQRKV